MGCSKQRKPKLFAFTLGDHGFIEYMGEVRRETGDTIRLECYDALMILWCGMGVLNGELVDLPRSRCRLFNDSQAMFAAAAPILRAADEHHKEAVA